MDLQAPSNPWDDEDCQACADRRDWPCDFHQGMDFGMWVAGQIAADAITDDVTPEQWQAIRDRFDAR